MPQTGQKYQVVRVIDEDGNLVGVEANPIEISNPLIKDVESFSGTVGTTAAALSIPSSCVAIEIQNTHSSNDLYVGDSGVTDDGSGGGKKILSNSNPHSLDNISGSDLNGNLYVVGSAASTTYSGNYYLKT